MVSRDQRSRRCELDDIPEFFDYEENAVSANEHAHAMEWSNTDDELIEIDLEDQAAMAHAGLG